MVLPTPYPDVNEVLAGLLAGMRAVLDAKVAGLYLYGSLTGGGFLPGVSDVDLLAVTTVDVKANLPQLEGIHRELARAHPGWNDRVEVQYMPASALASFKSRRSTILAISPGEPLHEREAGADWTMNWYDVQENGIVLHGPPASTFVPAISRAEFVASIFQSLFEWPAHLDDLPPTRGSQAYAILTMCRALYTCTTGQQISKQGAAEWAERQLPEWSPLIESALAWRRDSRTVGQQADPDAYAEATRQFIDDVRARVVDP